MSGERDTDELLRSRRRIRRIDGVEPVSGMAPASARSPLREGRPFPLGATWDAVGVNFAIFSAHATKVELCLFDAAGRTEVERIELPEYTDEVWHGYLPRARPGLLYGYRVHGPYDPEAGYRFNHHKLLIDPYAMQLAGALKWGPELFGYKLGSSRRDLSFDTRDSARHVPKCRVIDPAFTWGRERRPATPWDRTVIYEMHVRGFSQLDARVPESRRGTLAALSDEHVLRYLKHLGVTAVEFLPVHAFVDDSFLTDRGLRNYWGYNSVAFFAPMPRYLATDSVSEFKATINQFHEAGIEVLLDVVYNHTAEGNELGPTLSFKGIDNISYYRLQDDRRYYINDTGTGNTFNLTRPRVLQLVADSLRYWARDMGVDGFRFDLATVLARELGGYDEGGGFLDVLRQDPLLSGVKLIAEPWDVGPGGYQLGRFPPGWAEWNDSFRDTVRAYWRGDPGQRGDLAASLAASAGLFAHRGRQPWSSINFVTAHDGFTLQDLVSYNDKHNEANGENNRDGTDKNVSWNHGHEGPTVDAGINALRARQKRNLLATLLLAQGTPMVLAGDEFGHTQGGNNNAYAQDNETTWLNWEGISDEDQSLQRFVRQLIALRNRYPVLHQRRFLTGVYNEELDVRDVTWLSSVGSEMTAEDWRDPEGRSFGMLLDGRAQPTGLKQRGAEATLLILFNSSAGDEDCTLPEVSRGWRWRCLIDTRDGPDRKETEHDMTTLFVLGSRSLALFVLDTLPTRLQFQEHRASSSDPA